MCFILSLSISYKFFFKSFQNLTVKRGKPSRTLSGAIAATEVAPVFLPEHFHFPFHRVEFIIL